MSFFEEIIKRMTHVLEKEFEITSEYLKISHSGFKKIGMSLYVNNKIISCATYEVQPLRHRIYIEYLSASLKKRGLGKLAFYWMVNMVIIN